MSTGTLTAAEVRRRDGLLAAEMARDLVRIPSVHRPGVDGGTEAAAAAYVVARLRSWDLPIEVWEPAPGRPVVVATLDFGTPGPTLLFEGHTDVVTEGDPRAWRYPPFDGVVADGRLHGRGSIDTKGNVAAALSAVRSLAQAPAGLRGRVIVCCPCDEEGMMIGIKSFIARGWAADVDGAIVCEPEENQVCDTQKGAIRAEVTIRGRMAHGAMPLSGLNPVPRMARLVLALEELEAREKARVGQHPSLGWPSITPTVVRAPVAGEPQLNVIPDSCSVALDIRTVPGQDHGDLLDAMAGVLERLRAADHEFDAQVELIEERPWTQTPRDQPVVQAVAAAVEAVTGRTAAWNGVPGTTDGTFLHLAGVPIVTTGAGDRQLPHQANESLVLAELEETTAIYRRAAELFLQGGSR